MQGVAMPCRMFAARPFIRNANVALGRAGQSKLSRAARAPTRRPSMPSPGPSGSCAVPSSARGAPGAMRSLTISPARKPFISRRGCMLAERCDERGRDDVAAARVLDRDGEPPAAGEIARPPHGRDAAEAGELEPQASVAPRARSSELRSTRLSSRMNGLGERARTWAHSSVVRARLLDEHVEVAQRGDGAHGLGLRPAAVRVDDHAARVAEHLEAGLDALDVGPPAGPDLDLDLAVAGGEGLLTLPRITSGSPMPTPR